MILTLTGSSGSYRPCSCAENPRILFFSKSRPRWLLIVENKESWSRFFEPCPGNSPFIGSGRNQLNRNSTIEGCVGRDLAKKSISKGDHKHRPVIAFIILIPSAHCVRSGDLISSPSVRSGDSIIRLAASRSAFAFSGRKSIRNFISSPSVHCDNSIIPSLC